MHILNLRTKKKKNNCYVNENKKLREKRRQWELWMLQKTVHNRFLCKIFYRLFNHETGNRKPLGVFGNFSGSSLQIFAKLFIYIETNINVKSLNPVPSWTWRFKIYPKFELQYFLTKVMFISYNFYFTFERKKSRGFY